MHETKETHECCPVFAPVPWENKTHNWVDKPFIRDYLPQFFHMPFPPMMNDGQGYWQDVEKSTGGRGCIRNEGFPVAGL